MLLALYENVRLVFISPDHPKLSMRADLRERLVDRNVRFYEFDSFDETLDGKPVIEQLDALYMTRIQKEHNDPRGRGVDGRDRLFAVLFDAGAGRRG